jgi:hypothetical protein
MYKLTDREIKAGRLLDHGGLMPAATGAEVRIQNGVLSVVDGPFVEAKEVIGGYAIFELPGKEQALASVKEFVQLHKDLFPGWKGLASCAPSPLTALETSGRQRESAAMTAADATAQSWPPGGSSSPGLITSLARMRCSRPKLCSNL